MVLVALLMTLLMGMMALAVDGARFYAERRFLQNAADAAALACAQKLKSGGSTATAEATGRSVANTNLLSNPLGYGVAVATVPVYTNWYNSSGAADKRNLADGVVASANDCRVALRATIDYTFIRIANPDLATVEIPANAHAKAKGGMQPIVVNRYDSPPGPNPPVITSGFHDYTMQESTDWNCRQGTSSPGCVTAQDESITCLVNCLWGRERVIIGQGYQASDADFRGFIALDVRDYSQTPVVNQYYNGTSGINENALKAQEATYIAQGYPGPDLPAYDGTGAQAGLQIGTMSGNSSGIVIDNFNKYLKVGDYILVQLFDGQVLQVPDFTLGALSISAATPSGPANGPTFNVGANNRFRQANDTVHLIAQTDQFTDTVDGASKNWTPSQLQILYSTPADTVNDRFWFDPGTGTYSDFMPAAGPGTAVTIKQLQVDAGAAVGIYSVVIRGNSPQTGSVHKVWAPLTIGTVNRDFSMNFSTTTVGVSTGPTGNAMFTFTLSTGGGGSKFNGSVSFTADRGTCTSANQVAVVGSTQTYCPTVTFPAATTPDTGGQAPTVTLNIPVTAMADGAYRLLFRGSGNNFDGQTVRHVQELTITVGDTSSSGKYVNVQGYAVFKITYLDNNTVKARAVSGSASNPDDSSLALGKVFALVPWEKTPY